MPPKSDPTRGAEKTAAEKLKSFARQERQDGAGQRVSQAAGQGELEEDETEPSLKEVSETLLAAIQSSSTTLTGKLEEIKVDVGLLRHDLQTLRDRVAETEHRISAVEDAAAPVPEAIRTLKEQMEQARQKNDDLENRLRRNNIRVLGLPERAEGQNPGAFIETWLRQLFPEAPFSPAFAVERAHRVPARPPAPGAPPRPLLARLLNCNDRDVVLREARRKADLLFEGTKISFFPDFSSDLQRRRATFTAIKARLRNTGIPYSMAYPARLRVVDGDRAVFFSTPQEADEWLNGRRRRP